LIGAQLNIVQKETLLPNCLYFAAERKVYCPEIFLLEAFYCFLSAPSSDVAQPRPFLAVF
jgi:hypothetical protein